jgi:hypothetical protein
MSAVPRQKCVGPTFTSRVDDFTPHSSCTCTNHTQSNRLVIHISLLFGFTEFHPVLQLSDFSLGVCLLLFPSPKSLAHFQRRVERSSPLSTSLLLIRFLGNRKCFRHFIWWWFRHFHNSIRQFRHHLSPIRPVPRTLGRIDPSC